MTSESLFALFVTAGALCAFAGFKLGGRHFRRLFELTSREPPREHTFDAFEDSSADHDKRSN
jgi:hypothetical protein